MTANVVALDFDGVLHQPKRTGWAMGDPIPGAREAVAHLLADGHQVIVYTARENTVPAAAWLQERGFPPLVVTNCKPRADVYIDDKALRFTCWPETYYAARELLT